MSIKLAKGRRVAKACASALFVFFLVAGSWVALSNLPLIAGSDGASGDLAYRLAFDICGTVRENCVVDGDTIWIDGTKIRVADIDTPEIRNPKCDYEYDLGILARDRLRDLLDDRPFHLRSIGDRDEDRYGRKLRVLIQDGRSVGDILVKEGLARTWSGRREPWC